MQSAISHTWTENRVYNANVCGFAYSSQIILIYNGVIAAHLPHIERSIAIAVATGESARWYLFLNELLCSDIYI